MPTLYRAERINELISRELLLLLKYKVKDPRLKKISITEVVTSNGLRNAKIFYTVADSDRASMKIILNNVKGFFRTHLAKNLAFHHVPNIRFIYDPAPNIGSKMDDLLKSL